MNQLLSHQLCTSPFHMDAKLIAHHRSLPKLAERRDGIVKKHMNSRTKVLAVMARPKESAIETASKQPSTVHNDSWFDRIAINHLSKSVQDTTGVSNNMEGYDSLIEAASVVSRNHNTIKQQEIVIKALNKAFPQPILSLIRTLLPPSKVTREYFALFTTFFFSWLVGPCEVKESELEGRTERNVVHIKKCRFLEGTNCVGMCTNLCKMPSQKFIKDSFGISMTMVPNFDDMSCEMIFGQQPPAPTEDPVMKQPCYSICKFKRRHMDCTSW